MRSTAQREMLKVLVVMMDKHPSLNQASFAERQGLLAVVLVLTAVAGLVLLWRADWNGHVTREIGAEMSIQDAQRVQTILRAF
jgi:hypothetical protein